MWNLKKKVKLRETEGKKVVAWGKGVGEQGEAGKGIHIFSYKMNPY